MRPRVSKPWPYGHDDSVRWTDTGHAPPRPVSPVLQFRGQVPAMPHPGIEMQERETSMATFIKSLVTIYAADIERSAGFYGGLLGLEETYRFPAAGLAEHIEYAVGATTLAISSPAGLEAHGMPPATPGHPCEIGLKTDDLEAVVQRLRAGGAAILKAPALSAAGNWYAYFADPDGNWISVYQTAER